MKYKHYIITRFNLSNRWDTDKFNNIVLDSNWLKDRYQLFEDYCLPSIKSQTSKNFEWWVYFDTKTSDYYKNINAQISKEFSNFKPIYEKSFDDFEKNLPIQIKNDSISLGIDYIITTRLDNDDILAKDTIEKIQNMQFQDSVILEVPIGYTLEVGENPKLRMFNYPLNPFISLMECVLQKEPVKSVYAYEHGSWNSFKSILVSNKPQWIQVIHDKNIYNEIKGKQVLTFGLLKRFKFKKPVFSFRENLRVLKKMIYKKLRNILKKVLKK